MVVRLLTSSSAKIPLVSIHFPFDLQPPSAMWGASDVTRHYREPFEGVYAEREAEEDKNSSDISDCESSLPDLMKDYADVNSEGGNGTVPPAVPNEGASERNSSLSPAVLPKGSDSERNSYLLSAVLPGQSDSAWGTSATLLPVLPVNPMSSATLLPMLLINATAGECEGGNSASVPVLPRSLMRGGTEQGNSATTSSVLPAKEGDSEQTVLPKDGSEKQTVRPLITVRSTSLMEKTDRGDCQSSQSILSRLLAEGRTERGKIHRSVSTSPNTHTENSSDKTSCPSLPSLTCHTTEDASNHSNRSTSLPVSPPLTPSSSHHTSASQSPAMPPAEPQPLEASYYQPKKRRKESGDQGVSLASNLPSGVTPPPSYSYCIASAVENILIDCPEETRRECGQLILTSAMKILMEMKKKEDVSTPVME